MSQETRPEISSRLPDVGTSIFTIMSKMALDHNAINLSQGFPDFPVDEKLINLIHQYMLAGHNQYAPMPGWPGLLRTIADVLSTSHQRSFNPDTEIVITSGATEALYATVTAFINSGDEVILFDPSYDSYDPAIRLNGGVPVRINLFPPDFSIDWNAVEKRITSKTRMIIVNTPHNPTGSVLSQHDLQSLERIALKYGVLVLSDEVYERIIFDGVAHQSVLRLPGLASQSIAIFSFGKTFHATGWKVGYSVAPEYLTREIRKTHQFITFSVNTPIQMALAEYMKNPEHYLQLGPFFEAKRDYFRDQLRDSSFEALPSHGSYFQLMSYKNISSKSEMEMAEELTKKFKVAAIPVSVFYKDRTDNKLLRFCFGKREETLSRATEILRKL
jgi:methionine aminotransferase